MNDFISRQAAIDAMCSACGYDCDISEFQYNAPQDEQVILCPEHYALTQLPSVQQTLYGYDIEHLKLIANVLQKENLPPERVADALMDIGRIVAIVRDEFEETLRKAVEQCRI